jgi:isochorismate hydrolase
MLIKANRSALLVIDIQDKLAPAMNNIEGVVENTSILMRAAARLKVPQLVSEQYPQGLGGTIEPLDELGIGDVASKLTFSCMGDAEYNTRFKAFERDQAVIVGVEAHVCVLQTAIDLVAENVQVFVVADATTSRSPDSHSMALHRLSGSGVQIVTTEMVLFEWLGKAGTQDFKDISKLIK